MDMSEIKRDVMVKPTALSKMCNLRFLKIYYRDQIGRNKSKLYFPQGLDSFVSNELRYFQWEFYPFKSLPSDFTWENLVELILRHSHLKQLGNHVVQVCLINCLIIFIYCTITNYKCFNYFLVYQATINLLIPFVTASSEVTKYGS